MEADYLVVGAGAAGMAFTDSLLDHGDADVVLVDRRHRPGGHWNDTYPFVRLHLPSPHYGVNSRRLGTDRIEESGPDAGCYERATAGEVCDYFNRVLEERFLASGRVRFLSMHDYAAGPDGTHRVTSRLTGETREVTVRRKVVDATYLETAVPATHTPSFTVAPGANAVPVGGLVGLAGSYERYTVLGCGKTGIDACVWLLDNGVPPERIRWVRPRDPWLLDRAALQPLDRVETVVEGLSLDLEAVAGAESVADLFARLEERGRLMRVDPAVEPEMYHCATVSRDELARLREITDVVRLGRVVRVEPDRLVLTEGSVPATPSDLHVDCTATGLRKVPSRPVFEPGRITVQMVRHCAPSFNAALIGYLEATRDDDDAKNLLTPPNPHPDRPGDWVRVLSASLAVENAWRREPDLAAWLDSARLNIMRVPPERFGDPRMREAFARIGANIAPAVERLRELATAG